MLFFTCEPDRCGGVILILFSFCTNTRESASHDDDFHHRSTCGIRVKYHSRLQAYIRRLFYAKRSQAHIISVCSSST